MTQSCDLCWKLEESSRHGLKPCAYTEDVPGRHYPNTEQSQGEAEAGLQRLGMVNPEPMVLQVIK